MTAVMTLPLRPDGWTVDDLQLLPDDPHRYELVDGSLLVTPPPTLRHDDTALRLRDLLVPRLVPPWRTAIAPGVYFDHHNYRQPDVVVYDGKALERDRLRAQDVLLAVEVVSASTASTDRVAKPAQYAAAGIGHYWRLEREPLELVTYALEGAVYRESGRFTAGVTLTEPLQVRFELAGLV